jgi:iron complex outermembrane recepter protein
MHCKFYDFRTIYLIALLLTLLFSDQIMAQKNTASIKGKIIGADGNPGINVTVALKKSGKETVTNNEGVFVIQHLPAMSDTLIVSSIESKSIWQIVTVSANETVDVGIIELKYNVRQLETVEIRGRLAKSYKSDYSFFGNKTETPSINIPQSISSVTKEFINDKMAFTVKDAVDEVAGVNQYSGYEEYTIRGFKAENALDINGLRGYNTAYTSSMLVNIERIEVIKGPTATLYGNCDPGGTINLVTKKPLEQKEAGIHIYAGKWNHYRAEGDVTGSLNKAKTLLYRLNAGYDNTKSFRNNGFAKSYEIAPSITFTPGEKLKMNFDFSLSHINTVLDRGQPGYENDISLTATPVNLSLTQKGDYLHETDVASNFTLLYKFNNRLSFNSGYLNYYTKQDVAEHGLHDYITPDSVSLYYSKWNYPTHTNTFTNYFTYKTNTGKASHELLLGYDFIKSETELDQRYYELPGVFGEGSGIAGTFSLKNPVYISRPINTYKLSTYDEDPTDVDATAYSTQGIYLQDQISINKWKFLFSVREEIYSAGDADAQDSTDEDGALKVFLPRVGIVYSLKPNVSLYATYNKGFDPFEASMATQQFDEPFKPLTSQLLEAGAKANFFRNNLSASISFYQLAVQNVAVNANDISNPNLFVQQGENRSRGVETEATGDILPNLSLYLTYTYSECKVVKSKIASQVGMLAENAPRNTSGSYIKYTFARGFLKGFGISAGHSSVGQRNTVDPTIILPGYLIFNAGAQYTYQHFKIAVIWDNITNKTYWTGAYNNVYKWPGEPTNFMMNISYEF